MSLAFGELVTAMPPACRAEAGAGDAYPLATSTLHTLVDTAMRQELALGLSLVPSRRGRRPRQLPANEAWLTALTAGDGHFDADDDELTVLEAALRSWDEVGTGQVGPARATFRLSESEPQYDGARLARGRTRRWQRAGR